jgi:hypothetical protein
MATRKLFIYDEFKETKISKLKKGDIFKRKTGKRVYVYEGKDRVYSMATGKFKKWGWTFSAWDDISYSITTEVDIDVVIGFDF